MRRRPLLITLGVLVFLFVSALLSRAFGVEGSERTAITRLLQAEAGRHPDAVAAALAGCAPRPACRARAGAVVASVPHGRRVETLQVPPSRGFSFGGGRGVARVAWRVDGSLPVVQCVRVHRSGNLLAGYDIALEAITPRIGSESDCPARF